jgi:hypothetical protein
MRTINDFLDSILDKKRTAEAHGMRLDVMVLHQSFYEPLMKAISISPQLQSCWELRQCPKEPERKDIFLYGVKVMWSGDRLPARQAWFRYSNPNYKAKA